MRNVIYIFRPQGKAYSIERVFKPVMEQVAATKEYSVEESHSVSLGGMLKTMWANIKHYSRLSQQENTICHITCEVRYCAIFMRRSTTVMTTHDVMTLRDPNSPWYAKLYSYWIQFYFPMRHLKYLTCISESTRQELVTRFPWCKDKLRVITNPVDDDFQYKEKEFNSLKPVILHVGTFTNKNLSRVIEALKDINCSLRIIGRIDENTMSQLVECNVDYSNAHDLSDAEIVKEYENCDILSFPSLFEGFGMPIIEAQAVGRPVLTSRREPMESVAGGACVLVDPEDVTSIREGFMKLLTDAMLREKCVTSGLENVKRFRSGEITRQYMELYKEMESNMKH